MQFLPSCCRPAASGESKAASADSDASSRTSTKKPNQSHDNEKHPASYSRTEASGPMSPPEPLPSLTRERGPQVVSTRSRLSPGIFSDCSASSSSRRSSSSTISPELLSDTQNGGDRQTEQNSSKYPEGFNVGDVSKPPNSLMEASSRRIVELQARREDDRKATQRLVVKKFMDATALAFEEQNPRYASDENVSELLHQDIVLITYDKMKFFGKKTVQKKINTGMEQMLNMTAQVKSEYNQVAEISSAASPPEEPKKAVDSGGTSDTDGSALIGVATASSVAAHQSLEVEKKEKGDFHATEDTAVNHVEPKQNVDVAGHESNVAAAARGPAETSAVTFSIDGPSALEGKEGVWVVRYCWKYGRAAVDFLETFTIVDYKIKKLKRSRG